MDKDYSKEHKYLLAKKRVEKIKGFYWHTVSYILVNIFISAVIIIGITSDGGSFKEAITNFGVYSTWLFWGIGLFFHGVNVFGSNVVFNKKWEEKKIKEFMNEK